MTQGPPDGTSDRSAGALLTAALADLAEGVARRRTAALADEPDAVHQLRTTVRRLRNLLTSFGDCFEPGPALGLSEVLASYGGLLGECRDLEVRAADAAAALTALGLEEVLADQVVAPLLRDHAAAHDRLVAWHGGPGPEELDAEMQRWASGPPLAPRAGKPADRVATRAVRRQVRRVLDRADAAVNGSEEGRHDLRKAARRLRHTVDVVHGPSALGRLGQEIQGVLGDHRDALLLADHVLRCATGEPDRSSYDLVVAYADGVAHGALAGLDVALTRLREEAGEA